MTGSGATSKEPRPGSSPDEPREQPPEEAPEQAEEQAEEIVVERRDGVAWVRLNRPSKMNAVHQAMARRLLGLAEELSLDAAVRVVVLSGEGGRAFCAGSDIAALPEVEPDDAHRVRAVRPHPYSEFGSRVLQPVVAMVDGYCLGGGLELALHADVRYASTRSSFAAPEVRWGWLGGGGATQLLPRLVGYGRALELLATGDPIDAETAERWGLVDRVMPAEELPAAVEALAQRIADRSPRVTQAAKRAVRQSMETALSAGLAHELDLVWSTFTSEERAEGVRAFRSGSHA